MTADPTACLTAHLTAALPAPAPRPARPLFLMLAAATAVAALGPSQARAQDMARVISSTPVLQAVALPREVCVDRSVSSSPPSSGAGALLGALAGGAAGNAVGDGGGRAAAAAIGAVGGAMIGNRIENGGNTQTRSVRECSTQTVYENRAVAYDVVYEHNGRTYTTRQAEPPGEYIELQWQPVGALPAAGAGQAPIAAPSNSYPPTYSVPSYPVPVYVPPAYAPPVYSVPQYVAPPVTRIIVTPDTYYRPPPVWVPPRPDHRRPDRYGDRDRDRNDDRWSDRDRNRDRDRDRSPPHAQRPAPAVPIPGGRPERPERPDRQDPPRPPRSQQVQPVDIDRQ